MKYHSWLVLLQASALCAQPPAAKAPISTQAASSVTYTVEGGAEALEMINVRFERTSRLLLRETVRTKEVVDEKGMDASTLVEAWPLGTDPQQKPLYSVKVDGVDPRIVHGELLQVSRGVEDVDWWSLYKLGTGEHLLDTYVPLLRVWTGEENRYVGLDVPPDDASDARLTAPNVVAVLTLAASDKVISELLITCDDPQRARLLKSYFDSTRELAFTGSAIRVTIRENTPGARPLNITVPIAKGELDSAHTQAPQGIHLAPWKR
jgi:hypothetical protein